MTDKKKNFALPSAPISKTAKIKRPSTVTSGVASSSSLNRPKTGATTTIKEKASVSQPRSKFNKNTTIVSGDADTTVIGKESFPNFDGEYRQIAYGNYLRAMLEECMVDDKIEREETYMDLQMAQLADRFQKTTELLDQTNKRLKDMSFVVEQKRLLDMKNQDCCLFYETSDSSNAHNILQSLSNTQQASLDKLDTKNIDFGFNKNSGHQQLLDAVNDAIDGLEQIKKHSDLDVNKFNEYKTSHDTWTEVEKERFDLESLKRDFDVDFPKLNEKLLKEATAKIALMIENEEEVDDRVMTALTASLKCGAGASARIGTELSRQLDMWLSKADLTHGPARAIIAPHAGYSYCGSCSAFAYRQISPVVVKRIFILGPSHHVRLNGCALSSMDKYQTPLYDLTIDKQIYTELEATRQFEWMDVQTDEDEHSIEMHLPYIAKVMEEYKTGFTIIPILVGSISPDKEAKYGAILAPYLADPQNLFIISSDFCHWGSRFRYTWCERDQPIYQSIEWLDKQGMNIIEKLDPKPFTDYLNKYGNTICGRHPIGVLLQAVTKLQAQSNAPKMSMKFLKYAQSSQCMSKQDSSVSYASASLCFE